MQDIAKKELLEGDNVAFNPPSYKGLAKGKIVGFTPQKVKVQYIRQGSIEITRTEPNNVAKL